jgi:hypothetical protein
MTVKEFDVSYVSGKIWLDADDSDVDSDVETGTARCFTGVSWDALSAQLSERARFLVMGRQRLCDVVHGNMQRDQCSARGDIKKLSYMASLLLQIALVKRRVHTWSMAWERRMEILTMINGLRQPLFDHTFCLHAWAYSIMIEMIFRRAIYRTVLGESGHFFAVFDSLIKLSDLIRQPLQQQPFSSLS